MKFKRIFIIILIKMLKWAEKHINIDFNENDKNDFTELIEKLKKS